jgi:hypothetical protein
MKKEYRVTFRMNEDYYDQLIRYAIGQDLTLSEALRQLILVLNSVT